MSEQESGREAPEMVERVAAAMDAADHGYSIRLTALSDEGSTYTLDLEDGTPTLTFAHSEDAREHADRHRSLARARAAIQALREPTDAMRLAAYEAVEADDRWDIADDERWAKSYRAGIDAALSGSQTGAEQAGEGRTSAR